MDIREAVLKEKELNEKIEFNIKEMEMLEDLSSIERYKNSESIKDRFNKYYYETMRLIEERNEIKEFINSAEDVLEFAEEFAAISEEEFLKDLTEEEKNLLKEINSISIKEGGI